MFVDESRGTKHYFLSGVTRYNNFQAKITYCLLCLLQMESILDDRRWFIYHLFWYKLFLLFLLICIPNITFGDVCCPWIGKMLVNFDTVTVRGFAQKWYPELFRTSILLSVLFSILVVVLVVIFVYATTVGSILWYQIPE